MCYTDLTLLHELIKFLPFLGRADKRWNRLLQPGHSPVGTAALSESQTHARSQLQQLHYHNVDFMSITDYKWKHGQRLLRKITRAFKIEGGKA